MEVSLLTVGKTHSAYISEGVAEYERRLQRYIPYSSNALPDVRNAGKLTEAQRKEAEGRMILDALKPSDHVILLDERGFMPDSVSFARLLDKHMASGLKRLVFVVGGPYGFSREVYDRADSKLSLSRMTFSHEMIRLFFTEQVYRAMTILRGEPYHHA